MKTIHVITAIAALAASIVMFHLNTGTEQDPAPLPPTADAGSLEMPLAQITGPEPEPTPGLDPARPTNAAPTLPPCQEVSEWVENPLTGALSPRHRCTPEPPIDPYHDLDEATLAGMAYGDAQAAEELGLRKIRSRDAAAEALGLSLIYRSAALSGDLEVFRRAIGARYAYLAVNGEPQIDGMKQLLIFNSMGRTLGDERFDPGPVKSELIRVGIEPREIVRLEARSLTILRQMAALQTELTGQTDMSEVLEDA